MLKILITVSKPCLIARELFSCSLDILNILENYTFACVCVCVHTQSAAFPFNVRRLKYSSKVFQIQFSNHLNTYYLIYKINLSRDTSHEFKISSSKNSSSFLKA